MKKTTLYILLFLTCTALYPQDQNFDRNIMAGVFANGGRNMPVRLTTKYITEDTSPWHGYESWSAGVKISGMVTSHYRLEIAGCFSGNTVGFELSPPIYNEKKIYTESFRTISIPVTLKRYLLKNFFFSAGTIIDFALQDKPVWLDTQTGFGLTIGAGKEFRIKNLVFDVSPGVDLHSVVPFASEDNQQRLLVAAIRIGISYNRLSFRSAPDRKDERINQETY